MKQLYISMFILIGINSSAQVIFNYDDAGNQIYRGTTTGTNRMASTSVTLADQIGNKIQAVPVPVKTVLNVICEQDIKDYILKIEVLAYNSFQIMESVDVKSKIMTSYIFDMTNYAYGVYYLKFYLSDGSIYTKTITKTN